MLKAHAAGEGPLDRPPVGSVGCDDTWIGPSGPAAADEPGPDRPGTMLGPYKLVELIGEGGMGTVWLAQQKEPVKRPVALKVIKAGMDHGQVVARFEAERQALALMDHPNIAQVFDAGVTPDGRPYFVMELVKGVPITTLLRRPATDPPRTPGTVRPVCQAVQHAHQKGIIHRDLKPSNVLVALYDGKPVPKVIDFGVAKATGQPLTEETLLTSFGAVVGTLEYMSPEQADLQPARRGHPQRHLLAGRAPVRAADRHHAAGPEAARGDAAAGAAADHPRGGDRRPSTRLSTVEELPAIAARRGVEPRRLSGLVRGELDWIVMKALEKDRNRRYETANGFAMDVQRYLADEPVLACPPSAGYRLRKFVRRNKGPVIAVSVVLLCLVAGIIGTSAGLVWAVRERDDKAKALIAETKARDAEKQARDRAMTALRDMTDDIVENQMARGTTLTEENKEFLRKIIKHFEGFAAITADDAESRAIRAEGYFSRRHDAAPPRRAEGSRGGLCRVARPPEATGRRLPHRPEFRRAGHESQQPGQPVPRHGPAQGSGGGLRRRPGPPEATGRRLPHRPSSARTWPGATSTRPPAPRPRAG